jgi:hypothetical protein
MAAEVDCTDRLLARLAGHPVRLLRPPDGFYDRGVVGLLAARGVALMLWTVDARDWARPGVGRIQATVARELRPGAIILSTMAAATGRRPWPRCRACWGCCTPAAAGPSHFQAGSQVRTQPSRRLTHRLLPALSGDAPGPAKAAAASRPFSSASRPNLGHSFTVVGSKRSRLVSLVSADQPRRSWSSRSVTHDA